MATRGIMADNMFIGKSVLLNWLNGTLHLRLEKIEDTCTGAVACQLMDILHPGSINMKKVDFNVRNEYEFVQNYKELQKAFTNLGIDRAFSVSQLSKGKRQDNNEFMQWFKGYWDHVTAGQDFAASYDAVARRKVCKSGDWKKMSLGEGAPRPLSAENSNTNNNNNGTIPAVRKGSASTISAPRTGGPITKSAARVLNNSSTTTPSAAALKSEATPQVAAVSQQPDAKFAVQLEELTGQVTELKLKVETAERERDFYFDKLRDIEIMTQAPELADIPILKIVEKILYAADSAEAKVAMAEAQETYGAQLLVAASSPSQ